MQWYHAVILGIVEGVTEFLPVSSTGHLIIAAAMMGLNDDDMKASMDGYTIIIQAFALLAIVGLYFPRCMQMLKGLFGRDAVGQRLFQHIMIAFIPMLIVGPLLHGTVMKHLFHPTPVLVALALGGVWMIWIDRRRKAQGDDASAMEIEDMTWKHALGIGLFQCLSMWPGTSRALMTIAGGTVLGLKPSRAAEFSFLLGLPTIGGAVVYQLFKDFYVAKETDAVSMIDTLGLAPMLIGCFVTVIAAAATVKWLVHFLEHHGLSLFGWYRIVLCFIMAGLLTAGWIVLE